MKLPQATAAPDRKVLDDVRTHGWHVVRVPSEDDSTGWAFSVGLYYSHAHPEIVVFGLSTELMHAVLNNLAQDVRAGQHFEDGAESTDVLEGVRCTFRTVQRKWYPPFLGYALWFYDGPEFPALQCIWPDKSRNFPWDAGFRSEWSELQPLLFHDSPTAARVMPWLRSMGLEGDYPD